MTETFPDVEREHLRVVASLSDELNMPEQEVDEIFTREFDRLAAQARIPTFLVVLAMRNTRTILRERRLH
ncbi:MAG: DUF3562 domain-containing protein [Steroidobacteraceae bacterium]|jgi:hypothetical protein